MHEVFDACCASAGVTPLTLHVPVSYRKYILNYHAAPSSPPKKYLRGIGFLPEENAKLQSAKVHSLLLSLLRSLMDKRNACQKSNVA